MTDDLDRRVAAVNARVAADGRCLMHNPDVWTPAAFLLELPIGNVVPVCGECYARWLADAAARPEDLAVQPVSVVEVGSG